MPCVGRGLLDRDGLREVARADEASRRLGTGLQVVARDEPDVRFAGTIGEQSSMFFLDPSGNALEFKAFKDPSKLFAKV